MALHDVVAVLREERIKNDGKAVPDSFQGVTKEKIRDVLTNIDLGDNIDLIDGVFALLDNESKSWFPRSPEGAVFCHGATTAHLACHIGILQRGDGKLDREGRDYWIKPLRELGGIEAITLHDGAFVSGHIKAKSPNSSYRLDSSLVDILKASHDQWPMMLSDWASQSKARARRKFQAEAAQMASSSILTGHTELIRASVDVYAKQFLDGYRVVYVDDGDGDRITDEDRARFDEAGIELTLDDAMPDVLLWNPKTDFLWVIEAVTSDGEVDIHKMEKINLLVDRCGKSGVGYTTTYLTWKDAAARQGTNQNIAVGSYMWIGADPAKQFYVDSF